MFEFIEKVIYINLEHRIDRKQHIERELLNYFSSEKLVRFNAIKHENGAIGCTLSHIAVLEMAISNGWLNYLVVEDDAVWRNFNNGYTLLESLVNNPYDVITLGITFGRYTPTYKLLSGQTTTAYVVQQAYYNKLLTNFKEGLDKLLLTNIYHEFAIDQYWKRLQETDNWYCIIPSMMIQIISYSDIEKRHVDNTKLFL